MQKNESYYKKNIFKKICDILTLSKDKNKIFFLRRIKPMKNNTILNNENINDTNTRTCTCAYPNCNHVLQPNEGHGFRTKYGQRYLCYNHMLNHGLYDYTYEGFANVGTPKSTSLAHHPVGEEFETMRDGESVKRYNSLKMILVDSHFIPSSDSTVYVEYKSPIQEGLGTISKLLDTIEREGFIHCFSHESCGAHMHGYTSNIAPVRSYYHSLFIPLCEYIRNMDSEKRVATFGRDFSMWASPINASTYECQHENFINVQHENTIEFRLPKITSASQYLNVLKFWREATHHIEKNFTTCLKPIEGGYRKMQAQKVGCELVDIAKKYFD